MMAKNGLIDKIDIPIVNIHRIRGENDPRDEAIRYQEEIVKFVQKRNGLPAFDLVILGLGEDGHVASIFPGNIELFYSEKICDVTHHPITNQKRVTITGTVINNATSVVFLVTGKNKATIVAEVLGKKADYTRFPVSLVKTANGNTEWFLDYDAASLLEK